MKYMLRPLCSPFKWLICLLFAILLPVIMYVPTYYDFTNVISFYLPFVSIVLFSDLALLEKGNHTEEITFICNRKPIQTFVLRFVTSAALLLIYILFSNAVYHIMLHLNNGGTTKEAITIIENIAAAGASSILIGTVAMTIATVFNNIYVGYGFSLAFWIFWNINTLLPSPLNPFPLVAYPTSYEVHLLIVYIWSLILVMANCYFVSKSPFFIADRARRLLSR